MQVTLEHKVVSWRSSPLVESIDPNYLAGSVMGRSHTLTVLELMRKLRPAFQNPSFWISIAKSNVERAGLSMFRLTVAAFIRTTKTNP